MHQIDAAARRLEPEVASVRAARRVVADFVGDVLPSPELDELLLATSEVVTNAVEHGGPPIELQVERDDEHVRVAVTDGSPLRPRQGSPAPTEVRGRGMLIVDQCADRWGFTPMADGKQVWFEIDLHR